ncbi:MAG: glutamate 5-kinase, partial [Candidatus Omnitrophica bacterium]|nr:glutamate 5-kinase [Candidatus Omnitrophota bacterium]
MSKTKIRKITVKIGTKVLTGSGNKLDKEIIKGLADQVSDLMDEGISVVLVSSGAIGGGLGLLNLTKKNKTLSELQAIASVGQTYLMDMYNECFSERGYIAGQILLTQEERFIL